MTFPSTARLLMVLGYLVALAGVALSTATLVVGTFLFFYRGAPNWELGLGYLPLVIPFRIIVAACVVWSVLVLDARSLFRTLLLLGGVSFVGVYGWYFLLLWPGGALVAIGDLLYLVAGLLVGCARLLSAFDDRLENIRM